MDTMSEQGVWKSVVLSQGGGRFHAACVALSMWTLGLASSVCAEEKQVAVFEPSIKGGKLGAAEARVLEKALGASIQEMGYSPISKDDLGAVLAGENLAGCQSAECQIRAARLLEAGYVLSYSVKLSGDLEAAGSAKAESPKGTTATWQFQASLFNVLLAATAESAKDQTVECANCTAVQAGQSLAELLKRLFVADKSHSRGVFEVSTKPGGARVFVDNVEWPHRTPEGKGLLVKTFVGKHKVRVKKDGFVSQEREAVVSEQHSSPIGFSLAQGKDTQQVVFVHTEVSPRPKWRIALGVVGLLAGATLVGFGGALISVDGKPVLVNGQEDLSRVYDTTAISTGLLVPGALCLVGGVVLLALPGEKKTVTGPVSPGGTQTLSLGRLGTGSGLVFRTVY
jgi:hypothetical protein